MSDPSLSHRAPLLWLVLPFMLGLILAKLAPSELPRLLLLPAAVGLLFIAAGCALHHPTIWGVTLTAGVIATGAAYYDIRRNRLPEWDELPAREARLTARIIRVFQGGASDRFSGLAIITDAETHLLDLPGQPLALSLRLRTDQAAPVRGAVVSVIGVIEPLPRRPETDPFLEYLVDRGTNFQLRRGQLLEPTPPVGRYVRWRERMYERARNRLALGLDQHPRLVAALRGMLLGERQGLHEDQRTLYLHSGAMHLFAISGLHIGVIAGGIIGVLRLLRLPSLATFIAGSTLLWLYVDLTGALPSAVRAWLMVVCFHGAVVLRVPGNPVAGLTLSSLVVLLLDPMQLFGAGYQMSYAIVAALLLFGLPLRAWWIARALPWRHLPPVSQRWWHRVTVRSWQGVLGACAISVAAAMVGMVSGVAFFGVLTPTAVLVNVLLIPLATGAILAGFASLVTGLVGAAPLGLLFNHAAAVLVVVMQAILEAITALPFAALPAQFRTAWLGSTGIAAVVTVILWGYCAGWRNPGGFWLPPLLLVALVLLGVRLL